MNHPKFILLFLFSVLTNLFGQEPNEGKSNFEFLPSGLHFQSLKANYQEAKIGVLYFPSNKNLKIDLGNSIDLFSFHFPQDDVRVTMGIDFFAYALSTSFAGNRLQIDALDGLFGGNTVISKKMGEDRIVAHLRVLHNSAHLVDGHFNQVTNSWIGNKKPIPYTKDFGELVFAYEHNSYSVLLKSYGGFSYASLIRPSTLKRWNFLLGFETAFPSLIGKVFDKPANLFIAYNLLLNGENTYNGNSDLMAGIKFGSWKEKGITLYAEYYLGQRRFDEYYKERVKEFGIGFYVDFF
ncbi:MAG: DUF1207 domain-containing protein [Ignavibacteriales bacterium]|nr:DUF1207 domain-containing protein [Ignavibacteriales bacterium]